MKAPLLLAGSIVLIPVVYSLASAVQAPSTEAAKIAFVSPNRLVAESPAVRAVVARFQATQQEKATALKTRQAALEQTRRKLAAAGSSAERAELEKQAARQQEELQKASSQAQADLQASQREMQTALQAHLRPVLDELAETRQIDAFLNADVGVLWSRRSLDLTPVVIERLNATPQQGSPKP